MGILVNRTSLSPKEWGADIAVALVVLILGCAQLVLGGGTFIEVDESLSEFVGEQAINYGAVPFVALGLMAAALVVRRIITWPVFVFIIATYLVGRYQIGGQTLSPLAPAVALFTVAAERGRWEVLVAGVIAGGMVLGMDTPDRGVPSDLAMRIQVLLYFGIALFAGVSVQSYRRYIQEARRRLAEADLARETEAQRRVEEERVRIAREIHDITAHSLSAVSIQAAAAERMVDKDPQLAKEILRGIRDTSKGSLDEIRAMIGVLRGEGEPAENAPTNGTDHIDELVQYLESTGIEVTCDTADYHREDLPLYLDVAIFGIAREAATNIVKHARAKHAVIALDSSGGCARLTVCDDGVGMDFSKPGSSVDAPDASGGHGMQGMAERAHLLGGTFDAYNRAEGGFAIEVSIPYRGKESLGG